MLTNAADPVVSGQPLRVLVIEDDADTRANLADILELDGYEVDSAATASSAMQRDDWSAFFAIILDRRLPDGSAEELLPHLKREAPGATVVIVTGYADLDGAITAMRQGAADYILKPINGDALRTTLERIAAQRRLALAKKRSEAAFRTLVEAAPCLIVILRPDDTIAYFSPFAEQVTGYPAASVLGQSFGSLFAVDPALPAAVTREIQRVLRGTPARGVESPICSREGTRRWLSWNAQRLDDYEGGPAVLLVAQDVTERKLAEEELRHLRETTQQRERLADIGAIAARVVHDVANPLAGVSMQAQLLLRRAAQAESEAIAALVQPAERILAEVQRLHRLIDDFQDFARHQRLALAMVELPRFLDTVVELWQPVAAERDIRLSFDNPPHRLRVRADEEKLRRVIDNLIKNAVEAIDRGPGEIVLEAQLPTPQRVRISVRDSGPGIPLTVDVFRLFETTKANGSGLGLPIAKEIAVAHGGSLAFERLAPQGTIFHLDLPWGVAS